MIRTSSINNFTESQEFFRGSKHLRLLLSELNFKCLHTRACSSHICFTHGRTNKRSCELVLAPAPEQQHKRARTHTHTHLRQTRSYEPMRSQFRWYLHITVVRLHYQQSEQLLTMCAIITARLTASASTASGRQSS